jgi:hypothetical protein
MDEVKIWDHVLKWGFSQNPTLNPDPATWSDDDYRIMETTLQNLLPLIRLFGLSSRDFLRKVRPYRKLLKRQLYEDLLEYHLDPEIERNNLSFPRSNDLDSKIVNINIVSIISKWINKKDIRNKSIRKSDLYLPYKLKLLLRGSRDGFTPKKFHTLCDNIPQTVTFVKIKETEEIIGGYNPLIWTRNHGIGKAADSFIFSFKSKNNFKDPILSFVKNEDKDLILHGLFGPSFGNDLLLSVDGNNSSIEYNYNACVKESYENQIRGLGFFSIEDYEVFQIIKKNTTDQMDLDD